jgi:hypothetical protein
VTRTTTWDARRSDARVRFAVLLARKHGAEDQT